MQELDIVITQEFVGQIPKGKVCTIVHVYPDGKAYEIEWENGAKSKVETAYPHQIKKV